MHYSWFLLCNLPDFWWLWSNCVDFWTGHFICYLFYLLSLYQRNIWTNKLIFLSAYIAGENLFRFCVRNLSVIKFCCDNFMHFFCIANITEFTQYMWSWSNEKILWNVQMMLYFFQANKIVDVSIWMRSM